MGKNGVVKVSVRQGSVVDADVDVLVNASNTEAWLGSGVSGAIRAACGPGFQEHIAGALRARFGRSMEPGEVLITDAGTHARARHVAHVAVMDYREGAGESAPDAEIIRQGTRNLFVALAVLPDSSRLTVGMVALGAGTGGLGVRLPTEIACEELKGRAFAEVVFHGFQYVDYMNVLSVVMRHFDMDTSGLDPELLRLARSFGDAKR